LALGGSLRDVGLAGGGRRRLDSRSNSLLAVEYRSPQIDDLADENGGLNESGNDTSNTNPAPLPFVHVLTSYITSFFGGLFLAGWGAAYPNGERKLVRTALIGLGGLIVVWGSVALVLGLGLP
jgi:hypothetical protein